MASASQTASGKAFEYALAKRLAFELGVSIANNKPRINAEKHYDSLPAAERGERDAAAKAAIEFLMRWDDRLSSGNVDLIMMQVDQSAVNGDVRDIIISTHDGEIGISAKNRSRTIRNSRISPTIDFGRDWFGKPCSYAYFAEIREVFEILDGYESSHMFWRAVPHKWEKVYVPLLIAFMKETQRIFDTGNNAIARRMMRYMLGVYDYYKVYKENGEVSLEPFNLGGTLRWGQRIKMPTRLIEISMKPKSKTTVLMFLDQGWQLSFRLHSAESLVMKSLKFDVLIVGQPPSIRGNVLTYR